MTNYKALVQRTKLARIQASTTNKSSFLQCKIPELNLSDQLQPAATRHLDSTHLISRLGPDLVGSHDRTKYFRAKSHLVRCNSSSVCHHDACNVWAQQQRQTDDNKQ